MEFSRPEYWSGLPFPSPGDLPNPGIEPKFPASQTDTLPSEPLGDSGAQIPIFLLAAYVTLNKSLNFPYVFISSYLKWV